jgi:hypothetical protein
LLSVDDVNLSISRAFDTYKGEAAFWYWITLIPQLCLSLGYREFKQARYILLNLAKLYPQVREGLIYGTMIIIKFPGPFLPSSHYKGRSGLREEASAGSLTGAEWSVVK